MGKSRGTIDTTSGHWNESDTVLNSLRADLEAQGYQVEKSKRRGDKLYRPVLFAEQGQTVVQYEIDAFHPLEEIAVEVEAGRAIQGGAFYRDIIRISLMIDAKYAAILMPQVYKFGARTAITAPFQQGLDQLDALYSSHRLELPFQGVLLVGF